MKGFRSECEHNFYFSRVMMRIKQTEHRRDRAWISSILNNKWENFTACERITSTFWGFSQNLIANWVVPHFPAIYLSEVKLSGFLSLEKIVITFPVCVGYSAQEQEALPRTGTNTRLTKQHHYQISQKVNLRTLQRLRVIRFMFQTTPSYTTRVLCTLWKLRRIPKVSLKLMTHSTGLWVFREKSEFT